MAWARLVIVLQLSWGIGLCTDRCEECTDLFFCPRITGCLLPENPYEFIGSNLTLECIIPTSNRSDELVYFWKNDIPMSEEFQQVISPEIRQLNMPILDASFLEVSVHCVATWLEYTRWSQCVDVEYPPSNVANMHILVEDWKNLTLTWNITYIKWNNINISVVWTANSAEAWYTCDEHTYTSCFINEKSFKDSSDYHFNITVTNTKKNVENLQSLQFHTDYFVKPAPVQVEEPLNKTSRCVFFKLNIGKQKAIIFSVTASRKGQELFNWTTTNKTISVCDLRPNKIYEFKILAKPQEHGYWSNPTSFTVQMEEDNPDYGPILTAGGFNAQECHNGRKTVLIFLRPPEEEHQTGSLTNYTLTYVPSDLGLNFTSEPPSSLLYDTAHLSCSIDYNVYISVNTMMGKSPQSHLSIHRDGKVAPPLNIMVSVNQTSAMVHWEESRQTVQWTVFWCQGNIYFQTCQSEIQWLNLNSSQLNVTFDYKSTVIYGVSRTTMEGSSGLTWADCVYDVNKVPRGKPSINSVESRPNLALTVTWLLRTCEDLTLITHYVIQYCIYNSTDCGQRMVRSDHSEVILYDLQEEQMYTVRLKQVAVSGEEGEYSDPVIGEPNNSDLKPGQIVGIVFGCAIFLVLILTVFVQCFRFARRKWNEKERIQLPRYPQMQNFRHNDDPQPLPDRTDIFENGQSQIKTNGCFRQMSTDSGQGSLTCVTSDAVSHAPSGHFQSEFETVKEEGSLSTSGSKHKTPKTPQISQGYAQFTIESNSGKSDAIQSSENQRQDVSWRNSQGYSGGFSSDGFSNTVDPYVTAGNQKDENGEGSSESSSLNGSGCKPVVSSAEGNSSSQSVTDHSAVSQCQTEDGVIELETFEPAVDTSLMKECAIKDNPGVSDEAEGEDEGVGSLKSDSFKSDTQKKRETESDDNTSITEDNMHICYKF